MLFYANSLFIRFFFVSLERKAILLYIKVVRRIEKNRDYDLETVLNSTFCYELHSMNTRH